MCRLEYEILANFREEQTLYGFEVIFGCAFGFFDGALDFEDRLSKRARFVEKHDHFLDMLLGVWLN